MGKQNIYKFLYAVCGLLAVGFAVCVVADYFIYNPNETSAPFYVFILLRALELLLPAVIVFIAARIVKHKFNG